METACVKINNGSGFFAAKDYIVTCCHVLSDDSCIGDIVQYQFKATPYESRVEAIEKDKDLVLLRVVSAPNSHRHLKLDRVPGHDISVTVYGYPNNSEMQRSAKAKVGEQNEQGRISLHDANDTTRGYSGGPVCPNANSDTVIGIFCSIMGPDSDQRQTELSNMIAASDLLELWGNRLEEARYTVDSNKKNAFVYNSLQTEFIDPDRNLEALKGFANDPRPVLWWPVVAEGGSGKSRLAYEFAHSLPSTWRCCLLRPDQLKKSYLQEVYKAAYRDLLIISDYAYTDTEELGLWLEHAVAAENRDMYPYKIRVLLLQRYGNSETDRAPLLWGQTLLCGHHALEEYRYKDEDLVLKKLGKAQLIEIIRSYAQKRSNRSLDKSICEKLYEALVRIDKTLTRPLFAMFIVDAYLREASPEKWDINEALDHFSARELSMLENALHKNHDDMDMAMAAQKLWVLATITHGCSFGKDALPAVVTEEGMMINPSVLGRKLFLARFAGQANGTWTMKPMTPDILGEYYVLKYFRKYPVNLQGFLNEACQSYPDATHDFTERMFCDHATDTAMIASWCRTNPALSPAVALGLFLRSTIQADPKEKEHTIGQLEYVYEQNRFNGKVAILYSKRLMLNYMLQLDRNSKKRVLDQLRAVYEQRADDSGVVTALFAQVLYYYFSFIRQTDSNEKECIFDEIKALYEQNRENDEAGKRLAFVLRLKYLSADSNGKRIIMDELEALYDENSDNDDIATIYVKVLQRHLGMKKSIIAI